MFYIVNDTTISLQGIANSKSSGGTSAYLAGFINHLLQEKIEFGLIGNYEIVKDSIKNVHLSIPSSNLSFLLYLTKLFFIKKFSQKDIFYFQRPDHLACTLFSKNKIRVLHLHGQPYTTICSGKNFFKKISYILLERIAMKKADLILITDKKSLDVYLSLYPFIEKKIKVFPIGVDLSFFYNPLNISTQKVIESQKELVYIGRLATPKMLYEMFSAFQILLESDSNCHFSIAGTGPLLNKMKQFVAELKIERNVTFHGFLSKEKIRDLIFSCDAAILLSANEGSPVSIKEVLACGRPVIVNDVGDLKEYVHDDVNGYFVNPFNSEAVAKAILKTFKNSHRMMSDCIDSMQLYSENIVNQNIAKYIFYK